MDRILALTSKFLFVVGFLVTAGVTISLPWLNSQQVVNFYAASVSYADPINGTMNVNFPFYNLTVIQFGNWGACFADNYTYTSFVGHGEICTSANVFGYSVTIANAYGDLTSIPTFTILDSKATMFLWVHLTAPLTYLVAYYRSGFFRYFLIVLNVLVISPDIAVYGVLKTEFASTPGISANPGSAIFATVGAAALLFVAGCIK